LRSGTLDLDGETVNAYAIAPRKGTMNAVVHSGHLPDNASEIAVGPRLLALLHKRIGDEVTIVHDNTTRPLRIVGTVFSPTSESSAFNAEAVVGPRAFDALAENPSVEAIARVRPGIRTKAVLRELDQRFPYAVSDESVPSAPGPIRNLEEISRLPLVLALFFALLGAAAIGQALFMTAAERRRDIGVLRALGFRRRQVTALTTAAGTSFAVVAVVVGVPLGLLAGKFGWSAVANNLYLSPAPTVPLLTVVLVAAGLFVFVNLLALVPARRIGRRPPSAILRAE
jgi:putative ABC transport system permease protein